MNANIRILRTAIVGIAVSLASVVGAAGRPAGCPEGYVYLETKDGNSGTAGTGFDHSSLTAESTTGHWSDHLAPSATKDYYVAGLQLSTPNNNNVASGTVYRFGGRTLMLDAGATVAHCSKKDSICDFGENVILRGGTYTFPALGTTTGICSRGKATVEGNFTFSTGGAMNPRTDCYLDWSLSGAKSAVVSFTHSTDKSATWRWCGDCSGYFGRLLVSGSNATASHYSILAISNSVVNGTIEVQKFEHLQSFGDDAFIARAEIAEGACLDVASGHTTQVGEVVLDGKMNFTHRTSKLGLREGMTIGKTATVTFPAEATGKVITMPVGATFDLSGFFDAVQRGTGALKDMVLRLTDNGDGTKSVEIVRPTGTAQTIAIDGVAALNVAGSSTRVDVGSGATLDMVGVEKTRMAVRLNDATLRIRSAKDWDWAARPSLWLDASAVETVAPVVINYENSYYNYVGTGTFLKMGETFTDVAGNPFVCGWTDCRPEQKTVKMWNARYDQLYNGTHNVMFGTHPRLVKGGLNGKDYLSFDRPTPKAHLVFADGTVNDTVKPSPDSLSRIYFTSYAAEATVERDAAQSPRYAFFVFGSGKGGGASLLGGNAAFVRGGTEKAHQASDPIFAENTAGARVWLDGTEVDPTTSGFTRDWQVVTVDFGSANNAFNGLGYGKNYQTDNGGQQYAEIILFAEELTDEQRQIVEIYLAKKWGLKDQYNFSDWAADRFATVYGTGTVELETDATLGGAFRGTVNLNGHDLAIDGTALPPTAAAIDTTDCVGWFDPDDATTCSTTVNANLNPKDRLMWVYDQLGKADGRYALTGLQSSRAPWIDTVAHGFGPVRRWIDYSNGEDTGDDGNTLRFRLMQGGVGTGNVVSNAFKTLIMVQDSTRGGGQPFVDGPNVLGGTPRLYARRTVYDKTLTSASSPIYPDGSSTVLTGGRTYLDGVSVDGTKAGFNGRDEVLSVIPNGDYAPVCFAHLYNSQKTAKREDSHGEIHGEILMWNRVLDDAERKSAEAYLAYKWQGLANEGYSALTEATVTGSGAVTAASATLLPKFDRNFTGTVSVPLVDGLAFSLATEGGVTTAEGVLELGGGELVVPAGLTTVEVSVAAVGTTPRSGMYRLVGWTKKPMLAWKLTLQDWTHKSCKLRVENDGLYLDIPKAGLAIILR